jgi:hypothetical protein
MVTSSGMFKYSSSKLQTTATGHSQILVTSSSKSAEILVVAPISAAFAFASSTIFPRLSC